nr:unnamed protein product [Digitaria exilis]
MPGKAGSSLADSFGLSSSRAHGCSTNAFISTSDGPLLSSSSLVWTAFGGGLGWDRARKRRRSGLRRCGVGAGYDGL